MSLKAMTDQSCGIIGDTYILVMRIMTERCMLTSNYSKNQRQPSHLEQLHYLQLHNFTWLKATSEKGLTTYLDGWMRLRKLQLNLTHY